MRQELENLLLHLSAAILLMNSQKGTQKDYGEAIEAHVSLAIEATKALMAMEECEKAPAPSIDMASIKNLIMDGLAANGPDRDHDTYYHRLLNRLAYNLHIDLGGDDPTQYPFNALE
ncbi:MAG TPA: hypothetical protein VHL10_05250 [Nitrososphaera sp.]|jgi:hypothetical protein|nr:hypothetical protein [Nitrososphaera sp.]